MRDFNSTLPERGVPCFSTGDIRKLNTDLGARFDIYLHSGV